MWDLGQNAHSSREDQLTAEIRATYWAPCPFVRSTCNCSSRDPVRSKWRMSEHCWSGRVWGRGQPGEVLDPDSRHHLLWCENGLFCERQGLLTLRFTYGLPRGHEWHRSHLRCKRNGFSPWLGRSLAGGIATHSSILAWRIPRAEDRVGYSSWVRKESNTTGVT